jgi:hypothetical protein
MSAGTFIYYMYELNKIKNNIESKFRGNERERERTNKHNGYYISIVSNITPCLGVSRERRGDYSRYLSLPIRQKKEVWFKSENENNG